MNATHDQIGLAIFELAHYGQAQVLSVTKAGQVIHECSANSCLISLLSAVVREHPDSGYRWTPTGRLLKLISTPELSLKLVWRYFERKDSGDIKSLLERSIIYTQAISEYPLTHLDF